MDAVTFTRVESFRGFDALVSVRRQRAPRALWRLNETGERSRLSSLVVRYRTAMVPIGCSSH